MMDIGSAFFSLLCFDTLYDSIWWHGVLCSLFFGLTSPGVGVGVQAEALYN